MQPLMEDLNISNGICGLILQSTMISILSINGDVRTKILMTDMFENMKKAEKVIFPTFLLHGAADQLVPLKHSKVKKKKKKKISEFVYI